MDTIFQFIPVKHILYGFSHPPELAQLRHVGERQLKGGEQHVEARPPRTLLKLVLADHRPAGGSQGGPRGGGKYGSDRRR